MVSRKARPDLNGHEPVHVTMRVLPEIPSLRRMSGSVRRVLLESAKKEGFRLIHYSIMGNHLHLIAEGADKRCLTHGFHSLAIRLARAVNGAMGRRRGRVFSDRYHEHVLRTPREVRCAVLYVINNYRKHMEESGRSVPRSFLDPQSSVIYLAGRAPNPLPRPETWLLRTGYLRAGGPLDLFSTPGMRRKSSQNRNPKRV